MGSLTILYGSQTGNAEDLAKRIGFKAKHKGCHVLVEALDDFNLKLLPKQNVIIFVCSTTGHGQEPENMKNFFNFIRRRDLPDKCLSNLKFVVYGLGDSSYVKFNYVSKIVFNRLKELGAFPLQELVAGDEQHDLGCDGLIYPKLEELWPIIETHFEVDCDRHSKDTTDLPKNSYDVFLYDKTTHQTIEPPGIFNLKFIEKYDVKEAVCILNERVTPLEHFQDTRFFRFESENHLDYKPGDVCAINPANPDDKVELFIEILGLDPDQKIAIKKRDTNFMINYLYDFIPDGTSMKQLAKYYLDIQSVPRRSFFEFLWLFSDDELERSKLYEFSTTDGQRELYEYCTQPKRSILEVLLDFPKTRERIKFEYLLDIIPPIKPRSFSIASALCKHPNEVQLIVGVVSYKTRLRKIRKGLCSNYLANLQHGDKLRFMIKRSSFKLPEKDITPIVMIGPGLGIAPMRSFIEERASRGASSSENLFYFGCRFRESDFYFKEEFEDYVKNDIIRMRVAFSREPPKQYVQDKILEDKEIIKNLIERGDTIIYVAGNSKLPEDIRLLVHSIMSAQDGDIGNITESDLSIVRRLESRGRIQYDCW